MDRENTKVCKDRGGTMNPFESKKNDKGEALYLRKNVEVFLQYTMRSTLALNQNNRRNKEKTQANL